MKIIKINDKLFNCVVEYNIDNIERSFVFARIKATEKRYKIVSVDNNFFSKRETDRCFWSLDDCYYFVRSRYLHIFDNDVYREEQKRLSEKPQFVELPPEVNEVISKYFSDYF